MTDPQPPNPFECARRVVGVTVTLAPSDITEIWHCLTIEQAEQLLDAHGAAIAAQMVAAGMDAAVEIIRRQGTPGSRST